MRISDWSSDVCSSDLVTVSTKLWKLSLRATKSVSELTSTAAPAVPSTTTPTRPSVATRPDFLAAAARPLVRSQSTAASRSPFVSFSAFLQRSEEHTSELQSLMRISYAVFCLQKKNVIQLQIITNL